MSSEPLAITHKLLDDVQKAVEQLQQDVLDPENLDDDNVSTAVARSAFNLRVNQQVFDAIRRLEFLVRTGQEPPLEEEA